GGVSPDGGRMQEGAAHKIAAAASGQTVASTSTGSVDHEAPQRAKRTQSSTPGLDFPRFFSTAGVDPFDQLDWELRDAVIGNDKGSVVFEQRQVEMPKSWSQQ